ncbi:MAG: hypothetical protein R3228_07965 [Halioglobus sp.]|nr:hypothetical protein [Halioglobus sp.]
MYRYSANNEITFTPDDMVLYRESPFASWMERLTLENPDHGIAPDQPATQVRAHGIAAIAGAHEQSLGWEEFVNGVAERPEPVAATHFDFTHLLRASGKDVVAIARHAGEADRRSATMAAMRSGAEYIAHGQLALGQLACRVDLLIRSQGISELGAYCYLPCATGDVSGAHTTLRLCFAADLLQGLQGVLPDQLVVMRAGAELQCLPAVEHIERFRDLKYDFMQAQLAFRKHRMPDPAQSSHFGRWSRCAQEVQAQRAARDSAGAAPQRKANRYNRGGRSLVEAMTQAVAGNTGQGRADGAEAVRDSAVQQRKYG